MMIPPKFYQIIKSHFKNGLNYIEVLKNDELGPNYITAVYNTKTPLLVAKYHIKKDYTKEYEPEMELYEAYSEWMCNELETPILTKIKLEADTTCVKVNSIEIEGVTFTHSYVETYTPNDVESLFDAFDLCMVSLTEKFHDLSHLMNCFYKCHKELQCLIKDTDRTTLKQVFNVMCKLKID